jgi:hypothetical protein
MFSNSYVTMSLASARRRRALESSKGAVGDWAGRTGQFRIEDGDAITHAPGGQGQHSAQLSSPDDADGLAGRNHGR